MPRPYRVLIDPGHGGKDPGALNKKLGIKEKDIVLSIGNIMQSFVIRNDYLFKPYMTREEDVFISLKERCEMAKYLRVNVFLSIHTNARPMKGKYGIEIEAWCFPGSKKGRGFAQTLIDYLKISLTEMIPFYDRGVKEKAFYVLKHTPMTAALVELGFISDNEEALFLDDRDTQNKMAIALADGCEYFLEGGEI